MLVGIDVSKDRLDVPVRPSGEASAAARDGEGLEGLAARRRTLAPALVALEATGGFEAVAAAAVAAAAVAAAGLPLAVVDPAQVRAFGRATGRLAETGRPAGCRPHRPLRRGGAPPPSRGRSPPSRPKRRPSSPPGAGGSSR
jgi:hypothetical protein